MVKSNYQSLEENMSSEQIKWPVIKERNVLNGQSYIRFVLAALARCAVCTFQDKSLLHVSTGGWHTEAEKCFAF